MGPSMVAFLKEVHGRAKEADKFLMSQQPALRHSWNTMVASSFWDIRLSIACAATDAEHQNILHDNTLNLPAVARQPHPDPNYAPHALVLLYGPHPRRNGEISYISNKYSKRRNFDLQISSSLKPAVPLKKKSKPRAPLQNKKIQFLVAYSRVALRRFLLFLIS